eukprot:3644490-Prymnesium_polylepis.1
MQHSLMPVTDCRSFPNETADTYLPSPVDLYSSEPKESKGNLFRSPTPANFLDLYSSVSTAESAIECVWWSLGFEGVAPGVVSPEPLRKPKMC